MEDTKIKDIKKKVEFLSQRKIEAHISINNSPQFYNGFISEYSDAWFKIIDRKLGEIPIWFMDVYKVEPILFREEGK